MDPKLIVTTILVIVLDLTIILTVMFQTTKSEGLSGIIGGKSTSAFRKGGWDDLLEKVTKYGAVGWGVVVAVHAFFWYQLHAS
ncbi:MAG: preprotein translocase subunit SecG [Armatimonadota bacterium]